MKTINEITGSIVSQDYTSEQQTTTSDYTDEQRALVKEFFRRMQTIYGAAKYSSAFPDAEAERWAMREWAPFIFANTPAQLETKLNYAKGMMYDKDWQWPNVGNILNVDKHGAAGQAAMSYRDSSDVLGLPTPPLTPEARSAGQSALDALKANVDQALEDDPVTGAEEKARQRAAHIERCNHADKMVPRLRYMAPVIGSHGGVLRYQSTDIPHSVRSERIEESDDLEERLEALLAAGW